MLTVGMAAAIVAAVTAAGVGLAVHLLRVAIGREDLPALVRPARTTRTPVHRNGVRWNEAGHPPRRHLCWAQSGAWAGPGDGSVVWFETCPCGGTRRGGGRWEHRNSERRRRPRYGIGDDWPAIVGRGC